MRLGWLSWRLLTSKRSKCHAKVQAAQLTIRLRHRRALTEQTFELRVRSMPNAVELIIQSKTKH